MATAAREAIHTLTVADADAIAAQPWTDSVTPTANSSQTLRIGNISASATVNGVGDQYFRVRGMQLVEGSLLTKDSVDNITQEIVIDPNTQATMFPDGQNPIGQVILVGQMPARVIGVVKVQLQRLRRRPAQHLCALYLRDAPPAGDRTISAQITVRVKDDASMDAAQTALSALLLQRHQTQDFNLNNTDDIRQSIEQTTGTMTMLIASIAVISLIVGGIGVMNIMLVSVTERVKEIGVRMAVGARQADIMQQFLIEAVLVCMIGGALGVALALGFGVVFPLFNSAFTLDYSVSSIVVAFACSTVIGIAFGFLPARSASKLDPIEALARE